MFANLDILGFVEQYGYLVIFFFVFLQEIGLPTPIPNEVMLLFSGYLTTTGALNFWYTFSAAALGDIIGTVVLYLLFYFFSGFMVRRWGRFIHEERLNSIREKLEERGRWGIFLGRFVPYLRGYVSLAAGFVRIHPAVFIPIIVIPAIIWSGGYVVIGRFMGERASAWFGKFGEHQLLTIVIGLVMLGVFLFFVFRKKEIPSRNKASD